MAADLATFARVLEALRYEAAQCARDTTEPIAHRVWQRVEQSLAEAVLAAERVDMCSRCGVVADIASCHTCHMRVCGGCMTEHDRSHEWYRGLARFPEAGNTPSMKLE